MNPQMNTGEHGYKNRKKSVSICVYLCLIAFLLFLSGCAELEKPKPEPFYAETAPPVKKEFRWSNGKMPKSFDPALAAAPPETDVVRALYEGLTDTHPKTLQTIPAIAIDWSASDDNKTWTFILRRDAKWSNGEQVTAKDFVRSWKRLTEIGDKVSHYKLLNNIIGMKVAEKVEPPIIESEQLDLLSKQPLDQELFRKPNTNTNTAQKPEIKPTPPNQTETDKKVEPNTEEKPKTGDKKETKPEPKFGVEAIDNFTLKVSLVQPDKDFPALVANPIFRPIYGDGKEFAGDKLNPDIVTSGAFRIFSIEQDGLTLDRAEHYWNSGQVELERVRFIPTKNAESALEAYRNGEIDAVTNAEFEPLALKLLTPFEDFERTTHSALNFYEFNQKNAPFDDRRVREALTIAIERERLTDGDMDGASKPAVRFLPFEDDSKVEIKQDTEKAQNLLTEAGFPNGENFPAVKLLINRNNVQQRIARSVAKMWKDNLNIETEITVKESNELDALKKSESFDMIRRGVVLPTTDELANMLTIFPPLIAESEKVNAEETSKIEKSKNEANISEHIKSELPKDEIIVNENVTTETTEHLNESETILTEEEAMSQLPAIPLYFPTSYSLVKPYILGFEINTLDAPSLKDVRIDNNWQPKKPKNES